MANIYSIHSLICYQGGLSKAFRISEKESKVVIQIYRGFLYDSDRVHISHIILQMNPI